MAKKPKWRIVYIETPEQEMVWFVCRPGTSIAHFAADTLDDAVDIAIRSMPLLERVTIRDRMQ